MDPSDFPQDPEMEAAILRGIYGISNTPAYNCNGACLWNSSHITLGFKSVCSNVTSASVASRNCTGSDGVNQCSISTPQGIGFTLGSAVTDYYISLALNAMESSAPELVKFAVYHGLAHGGMEMSAEENLEHATIIDCVLSLAAYEYPGANSNGSNFALGKPTELELIPSNKTLIDKNEAEISHVNYDVVSTDNVTTKELAMGYADIATIQSYFMSNMISTQWQEGGGLHNTNYGISAALIGNVDLEARFAGMADSMTIYLRSRKDALSLAGYTVVQQYFVHIRWYWLAGPVAMELAAVLLAFFTIISNRGNKYPPWKSSTLAMLACSHDEDSGIIRSRVKDIKNIDRSAKKSSVKII
ncbi:hypothetical protein KCU71_g2061, partial [Aureobasidium melanogenum]